MTTPQAIELIRNIIGTSTNQEHEYILAGVLLVLFNIGIFVLISNFQKSFSRGTRR